MNPILSIRDVRKAFGGVPAVDGVSFDVPAGQVIGLVGENGAGKTTLMRMVAGELHADGGMITVDRNRTAFVHQHFMLVEGMTIAENLLLAATNPPRWQWPARRRLEAARVIASSGIDLPDPERLVATLGVGERAKVELIKALARHPAILILDEPTAVLTPVESEELFARIRTLAASGTSVIFISHKLPEVTAIADRIIVMRAGRVVVDRSAEGVSTNDLATAMVGEIDSSERVASFPITEQCRLEVSDLALRTLRDVTFRVLGGEIVAIVGVAGNGQQELARVLRGLESPRRGAVMIDGRSYGRGDLRASRVVAHIAEDRTQSGVVAEMTIAENLGLAAQRWDRAAADDIARQAIAEFSIRSSGPRQFAGELSGGNQQKVILARELGRKPVVLVAAEPTRGLDIDATRFVHQQIREAAVHGTAVLLITSDLDEAFALANTIHVIYRGTLSAPMPPAIARERVARLMAGIA